MKTNQKRGMSAGVWLIILLVLLAIGVVIYIWLSGDSGSIPQPPPLPP